MHYAEGLHRLPQGLSNQGRRPCSTLTLAAFLLVGGSIGDRFGRRKAYLIGTVWLALASAGCGFAVAAGTQ
jgi:nitrate/nitrite transporter NarK